jgi:hypothetical protein
LATPYFGITVEVVILVKKQGKLNNRQFPRSRISRRNAHSALGQHQGGLKKKGGDDERAGHFRQSPPPAGHGN